MDLKKVLIVVFLLSVFAVGTLNFVDTVEAKKWKQFDSGTYTTDGIKCSYKSYSRGSNEIRIDVIYRGDVIARNYLTKTKTGINLAIKDYTGKTIDEKFLKSPLSLKNFYRLFKEELKKSK